MLMIFPSRSSSRSSPQKKDEKRQSSRDMKSLEDSLAFIRSGRKDMDDLKNVIAQGKEKMNAAKVSIGDAEGGETTDDGAGS